MVDFDDPMLFRFLWEPQQPARLLNRSGSPLTLTVPA